MDGIKRIKGMFAVNHYPGCCLTDRNEDYEEKLPALSAFGFAGLEDERIVCGVSMPGLLAQEIV